MHADAESNRLPHEFCTTRWTTVLKAKGGDSQRSEALESLCRTYWFPLYAFVRHKGKSPEDSQDLVQGFFEQFLMKDYLASVAQDKGRFRTFLLTSLTHFMANEWDKTNRLKRGGGRQIFSIDALEAEERFKLEPADKGLGPDAAFDRAWAQTVVDAVFSRLRAEYARLGEADRFELLNVSLMGGEAEGGYAEIGTKLGLSEGGIKTVVRRMRLRFRDLLRSELSETLAEGVEVDDEIRHLLVALKH